MGATMSNDPLRVSTIEAHYDFDWSRSIMKVTPRRGHLLALGAMSILLGAASAVIISRTAVKAGLTVADIVAAPLFLMLGIGLLFRTLRPSTRAFELNFSTRTLRIAPLLGVGGWIDIPLARVSPRTVTKIVYRRQRPVAVSRLILALDDAGAINVLSPGTDDRELVRHLAEALKLAVSGESMRSSLEPAALPLREFATRHSTAYSNYLLFAAFAGYLVWRSCWMIRP
jgi:hypothetical protein